MHATYARTARITAATRYGSGARATFASRAKSSAQFIRIYRDRSELAALCERFFDLDEGLQEWRYRHVKMVERTIGAKMGTGGSAGAEYLRRTLCVRSSQTSGPFDRSSERARGTPVGIVLDLAARARGPRDVGDWKCVERELHKREAMLRPASHRAPQ